MDINQRNADYKDWYYKEVDTRFKIEAGLKTSPALFLIVFALLAYIFKLTIAVNIYPQYYWFWGLFASSVISLVIAVFFFAAAIHGYTYSQIPTPVELENYYKTTLEHYAKYDLSKAKQYAGETFEEYINECYIVFATQNTLNNDTKLLNLSRIHRFIIIAFFLASFTYIPLYAWILK
jgi:hypothetical protein